MTPSTETRPELPVELSHLCLSPKEMEELGLNSELPDFSKAHTCPEVTRGGKRALSPLGRYMLPSQSANLCPRAPLLLHTLTVPATDPHPPHLSSQQETPRPRQWEVPRWSPRDEVQHNTSPFLCLLPSCRARREQRGGTDTGLHMPRVGGVGDACCWAVVRLARKQRGLGRQ